MPIKDTKQRTAYEKERRRKKVLNGLCSICGKSPLETTRLCRRCNERKKALYRKANPPVQRGVCPHCEYYRIRIHGKDRYGNTRFQCPVCRRTWSSVIKLKPAKTEKVRKTVRGTNLDLTPEEALRYNQIRKSVSF